MLVYARDRDCPYFESWNEMMNIDECVHKGINIVKHRRSISTLIEHVNI